MPLKKWGHDHIILGNDPIFRIMETLGIPKEARLMCTEAKKTKIEQLRKQTDEKCGPAGFNLSGNAQAILVRADGFGFGVCSQRF